MKNDGLDRENAPVIDRLTPAERKRLVERHHETMLARKAEEDLRHANAIAARQVLNRLKEG